MGKSYLCKDCEFNNNGWCKKRKIQGLKDILICDEFKNDSNINDEEFNGEMYKQFGKREMFYHIQNQIIGIERDESTEDKFKILKQVMVNLESMLQIEEKIHGIAMEYSIDGDIHEDSISISNKWMREVGKYKGDE